MGLEGGHSKGMRFKLEELNLKVVMTGLEMRVRTGLGMGGGEVVGVEVS